MTRMAVTCAVSMLLAASALAAEPKKPPATKDASTRVVSETPAAVDSPLVRAAKEAKKARVKNAASTPVITDTSVKKSSGKLTILSEGKSGAATPEDTEAAFAKMNQDRTDQMSRAKATGVEVAALEKEVARLEKELASVEEEYYDESDVELREDLSQRDFAKTKTDLETARGKLAAARKRHEELSRSTSNIFKP